MTITEYLEMLRLPTTSKGLLEMGVIDSAHCCDCVFANDVTKVWVCRVGGGVTIESYISNMWAPLFGGCEEIL